MKEEWIKIQDYGGLYYISNLGRCRDYKNNIKPVYKNNKGYLCLSLYVNGKTFHPTVHRLVAKYFIPNSENYSQVNHIDSNKENNNVSNLEWCNQRYNYDEGMKNFLYSKNENHYFAKLTNEDVRIIYDLYTIGFTRATIAKLFNINHSTIEAIEKGISYRQLGINWNFKKSKYKDKPNIKIPSYIRQRFRDNTVLNTLIAQGKVSV